MIGEGISATAAATNGRLIQIDHVTKVYPVGEVEVHALRGVSLEVRGGEFVATLLQLLPLVPTTPEAEVTCHRVVALACPLRTVTNVPLGR